MINSILNSAKRAWRGKEKLWVVFYFWFLIPTALGLFIAVRINDIANFYPLFIYIIISLVFLWKCSENSNLLFLRYAVYVFVPLLIIFILVLMFFFVGWIQFWGRVTGQS